MTSKDIFESSLSIIEESFGGIKVTVHEYVENGALIEVLESRFLLTKDMSLDILHYGKAMAEDIIMVIVKEDNPELFE